ncbi:MAG: DUF4954 family protein, partial [Bacteroidales bacterium]|nr:DUF4954 family protein [Bacteroidales bacterium]
MEHRHLTAPEIASLEQNGCRSTDWDKVLVAWGDHDYSCHLCDAKFTGDVRLGVFDKEFILPGGVPCHSGI